MEESSTDDTERYSPDGYVDNETAFGSALDLASVAHPDGQHDTHQDEDRVVVNI